MSEETRRGKCECPLLRMAAETERMAECGILAGDDENAARDRIAAIQVALARERYGCDGMTGGRVDCPLLWAARFSAELRLDPSVPLLRKRGDEGQYI